MKPCEDCRYFSKEAKIWVDRCLMFYMGVNTETLRKTFASGKCEFFKLPLPPTPNPESEVK